MCVTANAQPLNGTYTIYGSGPDYVSLEAAANDLNNRGVSGPVVFQVRPGTWTSSSTSDATINSVSGASATNTITFEAENGDAATTIIQNTNSSSSTSNNFIFRFNSAKYVRVRNLTLDKTNTSYSRVLYYLGTAQFNIVEDCIIKAPVTTSSSNSRALIYVTSGKDVENNIIRNNEMSGGSMAAYWYGNSSSSSNLSPDNEISGNEITEPGYYGFYTYYTLNMKIKDNEITKTNSGTFYGFYNYYMDGGFEVSGNELTINRSSTSTSYGFRFYYCDGTSTNRGQISNNEININTSGAIYNYIYYSNYYSVSDNEINCTTSGSSTVYPLYNYNYNSSTAFTYGKDCHIENNEITSVTNGTSYLYGHYYYQSNPKFNNNEITMTGNGTKYVYANYYYQYNMQTNGNTIKLLGGSGTKYVYAGYYYSRDNYEFSNNDIELYTTSGTTALYAGYYSYDNTGYNKLYNNKVRLRSNSGASYNYMAYYGQQAEIVNNDIDVYAGSSTAYGMYCYANSNGTGPWIIKDNKVVVESNGSSSYVYGIYNYYAQGLELINNAVSMKGRYYRYGYAGGYNKISYGGAKVYNNTFHNEGSSGNAYNFYLYETAATEHADIYNNSFTRGSGSGYNCLLYNPAYYDMDYNNFYYSGNGSLLYFGYNGQSFSTISSMRASTGQNMNSLTYMPGFVDVTTGDLRPDPSNAASWALNGRGVQIAGNDKDMDGNNRALTTVDGVPDLGAYEFTPTVTPPNCVGTPAAPAVSTDQVFTFGEDTVAVMKWSATVPTGFDLKQYTGTNPPGITSINPTQMFFYVDAGGAGTNLDYEMDLYYKDPWMGTIASETALRLAEKVGSNAWSGYPSAVSGANTTRNFINTPGVMDAGALFTGIDVSDNASADAIIEPVPPFCPGTYTVKVRIKNNGNNKINGVKIAWELDNNAQGTINYTPTIDINGSPAGNEAIITLGTVNFAGAGRKIKVWTFDPNGVQDPIPGDDTLDLTYFAALAGTYTVGGVNPDFGTVIDAVDALNQYGTCGDVVFDIRPGTYTGKLNINNPMSASPTAGRVTFQAENGIASSVVITAATTSADYPVIQLNDADNFTFKNLTVNTASTYGQCFALYNGTDNDSIVGCNLNAPIGSFSSYNSPIFAYGYITSFDGKDLVIKDNVVKGGYYGIWLYHYTSYTQRPVVDNNTISDMYYMGVYLYRSYGLKFTNNKITGNNTSYYPAYIYYPYQSPVITGNEVTHTYGYGMMINYAQGTSSNRGLIANNTAVSLPGSTTYGAIGFSYSSYMDFLNNSMNVTNSNGTGYAGYFYFSSTSYNNNRFLNNVMSNTGGGQAINFYNSASNNVFDYNNYYVTGNTFGTYTNTAKKDFAAFVASAGNNKHSLTYEPGFTSATNLRPDKSNPSSWSLNGRAVHISGNTLDKDGNSRVDTRAAGVPDIGAYEFKPEVTPPLAKADPAQAAPGVTQEFTFGEFPVARVTWDASFPLTAPLEVRQYSGEKGMGVATQVAPNGSMYFYTDIDQKGNGTTYKFDAEVDYMDIWLGDIATEGNLKLAYKYSSNFPWMVYNDAMSTVNTTENVLKNTNAMALRHFGAYTGLEDGSTLSAFVVPNGSIVICTGNSVQLDAEPQTGDGYQWYKNGTMIAGATATSYQATQAGDYSVAITYNTPSGTKVVESVPVTISVIAPPNALIQSNGPLTYCVGNGLTLDAGNASGVNYQWQLNGTDIPGATGSTYAVNQPGNYTVVATNIGCSSTSTVTPVSSGPLTVNLGSDTSYCEVNGVFAQLDAGFPGAKYLWNTGDTTKTIEVRNSGNYWVEVDGGPNCRDRDTIGVTISPLPSANGISYVKNGNTYFFSPSGASNATGFMWLFSDGTTSNQQNVSKTLNSDDLYVRLVLFNNCGTDTVQLGWKLSVSETVNEEQVSLYPNPAKDRVTISVTGTELEEVQLLNNVGSVVYRSETHGGATRHEVDLSSYANGHYMLRARTSDGIVTKPFDILK